jgi:pantoate--beta-alanine ligase
MGLNMKVITTIDECRGAVRQAQQSGMAVGLVPTMGALHEGHLSLVRTAKARCGWVMVTIFVNPTQFGPNEDFKSYPRPLEDDLAMCRSAGVDAVFAPSVEVMYASDTHTTVHVAKLTDGLCGPHRPGHFDGVATVVAKLFHIAPADAAFFGEKDYQQLSVIRQMARDLNLAIEIVSCPTLREQDGLAMSSRNVYLSPTERAQAVAISRALFQSRDAAAAGNTDANTIAQSARRAIVAAGIRSIDYVEVVDVVTLEPLITLDRIARLCIAVRVGRTRLIDNVALEEGNLSAD